MYEWIIMAVLAYLVFSWTAQEAFRRNIWWWFLFRAKPDGMDDFIVNTLPTLLRAAMPPLFALGLAAYFFEWVVFNPLWLLVPAAGILGMALHARHISKLP